MMDLEKSARAKSESTKDRNGLGLVSFGMGGSRTLQSESFDEYASTLAFSGDQGHVQSETALELELGGIRRLFIRGTVKWEAVTRA